MIRGRKADGSVVVIDAPLIELASADGEHLFRLFHCEDGKITVYEPGDDMFNKYLKKTGMKVAPVFRIEN